MKQRTIARLMVAFTFFSLAAYAVVMRFGKTKVCSSSFDEELTACAEGPSLFGSIIDPESTVTLTVCERATGHSVAVGKARAAGLAGGGQTPTEIVWSPAGYSFLYVFSEEVLPATGQTYRIWRTPLRGHDVDGEKWVKPFLLRQCKSSSPEIRERAKSLLSVDHFD